MLRTALFASLLFATTPALADQAPEEAYEACLIGNGVIGVMRMDLSSAEAYDRAYLMCEDVAAAVPNTVCSEEADTCGPIAVSEYVIHYFEFVVVPAIKGFTIDGELGAEY